jgi:TPR repeat protein
MRYKWLIIGVGIVIVIILLRVGVISTSCCIYQLTPSEISSLWVRGLHGDPGSHWKLVEYGYDSQDKELALANLQQLSDRFNDTKAMYEYFVTSTSDPATFSKHGKMARKYLLLSANGSYIPAQELLANIYESGKYGFDRNTSSAQIWYKRAIDSGSGSAGFYLCRLNSGKACNDYLKAPGSHGTKEPLNESLSR